MSMARKNALSSFERKNIVDFKDQKFSKKKTEKISICNIEFASITRGLGNEKSSRTSDEADQKGKKSHYKKNEQWQNNCRRSANRTTDSLSKSILYRVANSSRISKYMKRKSQPLITKALAIHMF